MHAQTCTVQLQELGGHHDSAAHAKQRRTHSFLCNCSLFYKCIHESLFSGIQPSNLPHHTGVSRNNRVLDPLHAHLDHHEAFHWCIKYRCSCVFCLMPKNPPKKCWPFHTRTHTSSSLPGPWGTGGYRGTMSRELVLSTVQGQSVPVCRAGTQRHWSIAYSLWYKRRPPHTEPPRHPLQDRAPGAHN